MAVPFGQVRESSGLSPLAIRGLCLERLKYRDVPAETTTIPAEAALLFFLIGHLKRLGFSHEQQLLVAEYVAPMLETMGQTLADDAAGRPVELHQLVFVDGTFFTYTGATAWTDVRDGSRHEELPHRGMEINSYVLPELFRRYSSQGRENAGSNSPAAPGSSVG